MPGSGLFQRAAELEESLLDASATFGKMASALRHSAGRQSRLSGILGGLLEWAPMPGLSPVAGSGIHVSGKSTSLPAPADLSWIGRMILEAVTGSGASRLIATGLLVTPEAISSADLLMPAAVVLMQRMAAGNAAFGVTLKQVPGRLLGWEAVSAAVIDRDLAMASADAFVAASSRRDPDGSSILSLDPAIGTFRSWLNVNGLPDDGPACIDVALALEGWDDHRIWPRTANQGA